MPPFYDKSMKNSKKKIYEEIINNEPDYSLLKNVSEHAVKFIKHALVKDAQQRATSSDLL